MDPAKGTWGKKKQTKHLILFKDMFLENPQKHFPCLHRIIIKSLNGAKQKKKEKKVCFLSEFGTVITLQMQSHQYRKVVIKGSVSNDLESKVMTSAAAGR